MPKDQDKAALKRIFDLCQRLDQTADALAMGVSQGQGKRLRARRAELVRTLLATASGGSETQALPAMLREVKRHAALSDRELVLFMFLLERRVSCSEPEFEGRELLQLLSGSSFDLLKHSELLHEDGRLISSGLVRARLPHPEAPLEGELRISERFFRRFLRHFHGHRGAVGERPEATAYAAVVDHYLDLRHLVTLLQSRAAALFPQSYWTDVHPDVEDTPRNLTETILQVRHIVRHREKRTADFVLPLVAFREEFGIDPDEEVILLALLYQELFASSPVLEAAELVRLVSASEEEVFKKRSLLAPGSRLIESG
ncbi:MAG: hypothetical protein VX913_15440, partial [Planctomycetota bacterium]|nr:hypothetical protein [Planctomycetota bacterium]